MIQCDALASCSVMGCKSDFYDHWNVKGQNLNLLILCF